MTAAIAPAHGRLFTVRGAAQYLGMTASRVRALVASGALVALRNAHGRLEGIYEADCDAWVAVCRQGAAVPAVRIAVDTRIALLPGAGHFA